MTKAEVSRRQLGVALTLYLDDMDPVSVHVLASGGREIAAELAKKTSQSAFELLAGYADKPREWKQGVNRYWNAFKHEARHRGGPRQDENTLAEFQDSVNDGTLAIAWYDLGVAGYPLPPAAQAQSAWYIYRADQSDQLDGLGEPSDGQLKPMQE